MNAEFARRGVDAVARGVKQVLAGLSAGVRGLYPQVA